MKILFFATSEFAIPSLKALVENGYEIAAVVTQPDKPAGRHLTPTPSPVKVWAQSNGLKTLQPAKLAIDHLFSIEKRWSIDILVVASYGHLIPKEILDIPKFGTLNIHPSLLPRYRGPSPIQTAILNGDTDTGVTIIKLDEEMDHGDIVSSIKYQVSREIYFKDLHDRLAELGAELLIKTLPDYISGKIKPKPQDHAAATFTKIITKDDARIDWKKSAEQIESMVRAYHQWPVAWTTLDGKRLKIFKARNNPSPTLPHKGGGISFVPFPPLVGGIEGGAAQPGTVNIQNQKILIHCGQGLLEIQELHLEAAAKLAAADFMRGYRVLAGKTLI